MKVRIHKDITARWRVKTAGQATALTGRDLAVIITDPNGRKRSVPYSVTDTNLITFVFYGKDQDTLGKYTATLLENSRKERSTALDCVDFVTLVRYTTQEETSNQDNLTVASMDLSGDLTTNCRGASAYEVWLSMGNTGSEADFITAITGPRGAKGNKGDKGDKGDTGETGATGPQGPAGSDASVTKQNIATALGYTPASDNAVVHKTGNETISGEKTFTTIKAAEVSVEDSFSADEIESTQIYVTRLKNDESEAIIKLNPSDAGVEFRNYDGENITIKCADPTSSSHAATKSYVDALDAKIGNLSSLTTTAKTSAVAAINELKSAFDALTIIDEEYV